MNPDPPNPGATADKNSILQPQVQDSELMLTKRGVPAWLMSTILHVILFTGLLIVITPDQRGAAVEGERSVGIVLVQNTEQNAEFLTEGSPETAADGEQAAQAVEAAVPQPTELVPDLPGLPAGETATETGDPNMTLPGAEGLLNGVSSNVEFGGKISTQVFGLKGTGTRFIYVFDRSGSMEGFGGRPLAAAKAQLIASINSLGPTHQFQVVFYNDTPMAFTPDPNEQPKLMFATDENKALVANFIRRISGLGSTQHMPALRMAVGMSPDVIFFLTDAQYPQLKEDELRKVERLNRAAASINTIEFGTGATFRSNNFLVRLAKQNHGQHTYKDVTRFGGHSSK